MKEPLDEHLLSKTSEGFKYTTLSTVLIVLIMVGSILSTIISWRDIYSIMVSGGIMLILGMIASYFGIRTKANAYLFFGLIPVIITLFWFTLINLQSLSPTDCEFIVPLSLSIATGVVILIGLFIITKIVRTGK